LDKDNYTFKIEKRKNTLTEEMLSEKLKAESRHFKNAEIQTEIILKDKKYNSISIQADLS